VSQTRRAKGKGPTILAGPIGTELIEKGLVEQEATSPIKEASPNPKGAEKRRRRRCTRLRRSRRPPAGLPDAMRCKGVDEYRVAELYVCLTEALRTGDKKHCANPKLMLDALKECTRNLELSRDLRLAGGKAPAPVQLMHHMLRPERNKPADAPPEPASAARENLQEAAALG
jgi:hypothetical protein